MITFGLLNYVHTITYSYLNCIENLDLKNTIQSKA